MARHMESLKDHGQNIEVEELINMLKDDNKGRIVFVGGVAGIGKSVLAKRIAYDWSSSEVYRHIKCLLYITCRKLNNFLQKSDKEIGIEEIEKYFGDVPVRDDKATLFLIDGLDELQKPDMVQAFTEKFSESKFLIFARPHTEHFVDTIKESLVKKTSFEEDDEISYQLVEKLANGKEVAKKCGDGVITYEGAQSVIRGILNQLPSKEVLLKVRFLADCFVASDKVRDVKFLVELLKSIKPRSNVTVKLNTFDQSNLLSILKLATGNEVANSKIKNAFSGIQFHIDDLREMKILDYAGWIDIGWVQLINVNHFTEDQSMLVHRNVAFCRSVWFNNCKVPLFTTNANESTTKMKLEELTMTQMRIDHSDISSAANLFGLAEWVVLEDVRVGGKEFENIMKKVFEMEQWRLKRMSLHYCPLVNRDLKQKNERIKILLVKLEADFHPSEAMSFVFDSNPCLDLADERNNAEMPSELNQMISSIIDQKFIVISNAPGNQVEANEIKQKFADEIGCPVFVNIELKKYEPRVVVELLTVGYEESTQCKGIFYARSFWKPKIIAVKLDNDFHPCDELNMIVREKTCICWTDETNFNTNFAKVKEEINAYFEQQYHNPDAKTQKWERLQTSVISKYVNWKKAGKLIAGTSSECLEKLSELSSFSQLENVLNDWKDYPKILDSMRESIVYK
eukprot:gene13683-biopygen10981